MLVLRPRSSLVVALVVGVVGVGAGCPGDDGDDDGTDAGPRGNQGGAPPFEIVDAGVQADAGFEPAPCVDDVAEDNDTTATATAIENGVAVDAHACGGDDDWYALDIGNGCVVSASLELVAPADGTLDPLKNLNLVLVNADSGAVVGSGSGFGTRDALNVAVPGAGRYAVRVNGNSSTDVDYRLSVATSCGTDVVCPVDDVREDNDTAITAADLDGNGVAFSGAVCGDDSDFFAVDTEAGCMSDVQVSFEHDRGDIDLELHTKTEPSVRVANSNTTSDRERLVRVVDPATTVARVLLFQGADTNAGNAYRVSVDSICLSDLACPGDDPFENNDTRQTAAKLEQNSEVLGAVCGIDEDFFAFDDVENGCTIRFKAAFSHAAGDIDMKLLTSAGVEIASGVSITDDEEFTFTATSATPTDLVLRVFAGANGAQNRYRLTMSTTCP